MRSRPAGVLVLVISLGLIAYVWYSATTHGRYDLKAAMVGPLFAVIALGLLIHGDAMPTTTVTPLLRAYGIVGSLCSVVSLYLLGFYQHEDRIGRAFEIGIPILLIGMWFLPGHLLVRGAQSSEKTPANGTSREPIEPR